MAKTEPDSSDATVNFEEEESDSGDSGSRWLSRKVLGVLVVTFFLSASMGSWLTPLTTVYAAYKSRRKAVFSLALGTAFYVLSFDAIVNLRPNLVVAFIFAGFIAKRYAIRKYPTEKFRRPIGNGNGYYYNPMKVGLRKRIAIRLLCLPLVFVRIPLLGAIGRRVMLLLAGGEIEPDELQENDTMFNEA